MLHPDHQWNAGLEQVFDDRRRNTLIGYDPETLRVQVPTPKQHITHKPTRQLWHESVSNLCFGYMISSLAEHFVRHGGSFAELFLIGIVIAVYGFAF